MVWAVERKEEEEGEGGGVWPHAYHCSVVKQPELVPPQQGITVELLHGPALVVGVANTILVQAVQERVVACLGRREENME